MKATIVTRLKRFAGIDTRREKYAYAQDPVYGHISESRVADKWTKTTCGYCSVGCGVLVGTRDNKAVAVRGNPDHPVNKGKLCPKGLSEHHILSAPGRAKEPLLRKNGVLTPVSWEEAIETMVTASARYSSDMGMNRWVWWGQGNFLRKSATRWASWCSWASVRVITTEILRCAWHPRFPDTSFLWV